MSHAVDCNLVKDWWLLWRCVTDSSWWKGVRKKKRLLIVSGNELSCPQTGTSEGRQAEEIVLDRRWSLTEAARSISVIKISPFSTRWSRGWNQSWAQESFMSAVFDMKPFVRHLNPTPTSFYYFCPPSQFSSQYFFCSSYFAHIFALVWRAWITSEVALQDLTAEQSKIRSLCFLTCHCDFFQLLRHKGVLTFPKVPEDLKGNFKRVTE